MGSLSLFLVFVALANFYHSILVVNATNNFEFPEVDIIIEEKVVEKSVVPPQKQKFEGKKVTVNNNIDHHSFVNHFPDLMDIKFENVDLATVIREETASPTEEPSFSPSSPPTSAIPSFSPSISPSLFPSVNPTALPTLIPSDTPSEIPTVAPTFTITANPTLLPTETPSLFPTIIPTAIPTFTPSTQPTVTPTYSPSVNPSFKPTTVTLGMFQFSSLHFTIYC
jgi:hypothetical protein